MTDEPTSKCTSCGVVGMHGLVDGKPRELPLGWIVAQVIAEGRSPKVRTITLCRPCTPAVLQ